VCAERACRGARVEESFEDSKQISRGVAFLNAQERIQSVKLVEERRQRLRPLGFSKFFQV
jgi:hypothetical protein